MASTSDGWPQFIKTFDEWRERRAAEGGGTGQLRADEPPTSTHRAMDSAWAITGGAAVFLGSLLPFITFSYPGMGLNPGARAASALFGLIVLGLGIALRAVQRRFLTGTSIVILCLSALGALGYAITIAVGLAGVTEQDSLGDSVKITFSPGIGILFALAGCVAAAVAGIRSAQHYRS
jgi:hypothetical protein